MKLALVILVILFDVGRSCKSWCRKPMSFDYYCCDDGQVNTAKDLTSAPVNNSLAPNVATAKSCVYYCVYNQVNVYCCDDGSRTRPSDHSEHGGRCTYKKEQVCKKDAIFLHAHAVKIKTQSGNRILASHGQDGSYLTCASDGYCKEEEKCCENKCIKKHTYLKAVYDYNGGKQKKKQQKNKP